MTVDPAVIPGLLLLAAELLALAAVGFVVARVALRQTDNRMALAQGLVIGPAVWGLIANFVMYLLPGMAGAAAAWVITLALVTGLAWRDRFTLGMPQRTVAGFAVATLALFWVALASRQLLTIVEAYLHLGLSASIRAGGFPPAFPWQPAIVAPYHYGVDLLVALLAPPFGPDAAFTTEIIGAYAWTSLALVAVTTVLRFGSVLTAMAICPLLLSFGLWTHVHYTTPPGILQVLVPAGVPSTGFRTSLTGIYWPSVEYPWTTAVEGSPANIWKPNFVLAYALALVVLERVAARRERRWPAHAALTVLIGFLGLVDEMVAPIVLGVWAALATLQLFQDGHFTPLLRKLRRRGAAANLRWAPILRASTGPVAGAMLLAVAGGALTSALTRSSRSGLSLGWIADTNSQRPVGEFTALPGSVGLLELGVVPVAALAAVLARRNRLVLGLVAASALQQLVAMTLQYEFSSSDLVRPDGHARNLALLALLVALGARLAALTPRWRYAASAFVVTLVTWPTAVAPMHNISLALSRGPQLANARPEPSPVRSEISGRYLSRSPISEMVAAYILEHTAADSRVLSPHPIDLSIDTGRPNAAGYARFTHFTYAPDPEYLDAVRYLEPASFRRRHFAYVHATDDWIASLPYRAARWLNDPRLFEPLIRDGTDHLYRVRSAFLDLSASPAPESFEALRQAVPPSTKVYVSPSIEYEGSARAASVLSHTQLFGVVRTFRMHLRADFGNEPLGSVRPDLVLTSARLAPTAFAPDARRPVWWNEDFAVYAPAHSIVPIMDPPPRHFSVRLSGIRRSDGRLAFAAVFTDQATDRWGGQDWLIFEADASPWDLPFRFRSRGAVRDGPRWFKGQLEPVSETSIHEYLYLYELEPRTGTLALWNGSGYASLAEPQQELGPGEWVLAVRLNKIDLEESAFIPLLRFVLTDTGEFSYEVYEGALDAMLIP